MVKLALKDIIMQLNKKKGRKNIIMIMVSKKVCLPSFVTLKADLLKPGIRVVGLKKWENMLRVKSTRDFINPSMKMANPSPKGFTNSGIKRVNGKPGMKKGSGK